MPSLPEELHQDIFLRLPMKSLLACKYVCKSWFKLISDPSFVKSQLNLAVQKNVDDPGFIFQYCDDRKGYGLCFKSYRSLSSSSSMGDLYDNCVELGYPFQLNKCAWWLFGSCNGLLCLWLNKGNDKGFLCLWNPATTEYKAIPDLPFKPRCNYVFGYDYNSDDYIVLRVSYYCECLSLAVYTLRSNSWKFIQTNLYKCGYGTGVFVNSTFNSLVTRVRGLSKLILVSLDTSNEEFVELQLPEEPNLENEDFLRKVVELEGYLSVVHMFKVRWDVWMMQNYGVEESWTKRYVIALGGIIESPWMLMWSFKNGEILLLTSPFNLVLYDTVHETARELKRLKQVYGIANYVESLVSLNSGTYMKERRKNRTIDRIMGACITRWNIIIPSCVLIVIAKQLLSRN